VSSFPLWAAFRSRAVPLILLTFLLTACLPQPAIVLTPILPTGTKAAGPTLTPLPQRPQYDPAELVDYTAQDGDTLPALAAHFNTTINEIRSANPQIPADATTMPPGMPMQIPIYYQSFWGTPFKSLPDSLYVYGPAVIGFDTEAFVSSHPGWLKDFVGYVGGANRSGAGMVDYVALNYSISPRILLAILEYQTGALSQPSVPTSSYALGQVDYNYAGIYLQLVWAADTLNNGYYGWRTGQLTSFDHPDGRTERPDPWQNAASVALQYYFSRHLSQLDYDRAVGPDGLARVYQNLFGDPWLNNQAHIPVSLQQPSLTFPFQPGKAWALTGGPHSGWGTMLPWAALDFAPPSEVSGCVPSDQQVTAMADGIVVRSDYGVVVEDLDGDRDERTGWDLLYLHVATIGRVPAGTVLKKGDQIGFPSCEGGEATGTHVHIVRKYNGEWIPADGPLAFNLDGWIAHSGSAHYLGTLTRGTRVVTACTCADAASLVMAGP